MLGQRVYKDAGSGRYIDLGWMDAAYRPSAQSLLGFVLFCPHGLNLSSSPPPTQYPGPFFLGFVPVIQAQVGEARPEENKQITNVPSAK